MFIVFEGHDGAGKTTQMAKLGAYLSELTGREIKGTRQPGGTPVAEELRTLALQGKGGETVDKYARTLLTHAARQVAWTNKIAPWLQAGHIVLCDRWLWSGYLYQSIGEGVEASWWTDSSSLLRNSVGIPDLTIVLKVSDEERRRRKGVIGGSTDITESMGSEFEKRISTAIDDEWTVRFLTKQTLVIEQKDGEDEDAVFKRIVEGIKPYVVK